MPKPRRAALNHYKEWTEVEEGYLLAQRRRGVGWAEIGKTLGRKPSALRSRVELVIKKGKEKRHADTINTDQSSD